VCDTQEEAKRLAYGTERHKVVTLKGTLINRAGVMTGGLSRNLETRAQRWDEKVTGSLKEVPRLLPLFSTMDMPVNASDKYDHAHAHTAGCRYLAAACNLCVAELSTQLSHLAPQRLLALCPLGLCR